MLKEGRRLPMNRDVFSAKAPEFRASVWTAGPPPLSCAPCVSEHPKFMAREQVRKDERVLLRAFSEMESNRKNKCLTWILSRMYKSFRKQRRIQFSQTEKGLKSCESKLGLEKPVRPRPRPVKSKIPRYTPWPCGLVGGCFSLAAHYMPHFRAASQHRRLQCAVLDVGVWTRHGHQRPSPHIKNNNIVVSYQRRN